MHDNCYDCDHGLPHYWRKTNKHLPSCARCSKPLYRNSYCYDHWFEREFGSKPSQAASVSSQADEVRSPA